MARNCLNFCCLHELNYKKLIFAVTFLFFVIAGFWLHDVASYHVSHYLLISLFLILIILASLFCGFRAGLVVTAISVVTVKFLWAGFFSFQNIPDLTGMIFLVTAGLITSFVSDLIRRSLEKVAAAEAKTAFLLDLQKSEDNLRKSEELLQQALYISRSFVFEWTLESDLIRRSENSTKILGLTGESALCGTGEEFFQNVMPEDRAVLFNKLAALKPDNNTCEVLYCYLRPDGHKVMLEQCAKAFFDENGTVIRMAGISTDVTVREEAVKKLKESEKRYRLFSESVPAMLWACDAEGNITDCNAKFCDYTGLSLENFHKRICGDVIHPDDLPHVEDVWNKTKKAGSLFETEYRIRRGYDGSYRWHMVQGVPVRNDSGVVSGWYGTCLDIEDRRQAEKGLKEAHDMLEKQVEDRTIELDMTIAALREEIADRIKAVEELNSKDRLLIQQNRLAAMGEMVNNIAHQWRQPLNTLGLNIQRTSLFYELGDFNKEFLDKSTQEAMDLIQHMSQTIDDFRNFFRPDKEKANFSINDAINRTVSLIEGSFRNQNFKVFSRSQREVLVKGYQNEFCQALLNIIQNAREALSNRQIRDGVLFISTTAQDGKTIITLRDNAGGIPEEIMDKIFEPYFTTKGLQGTGIGLFMSKKIIESNMGGRISVKNADSGAEFTIEFMNDHDTVEDDNKQIPLF